MISTVGPNGDSGMTPERMLQIVAEECDEVKSSGNVAELLFRSVPLVLVFDVNADRMRIISAIKPVNQMMPEELSKAMEANFHSALDARYAVSDGTVWAAFIHPLSDLTESLLRSAIRQVATARVTFGKEFSSGELFFGG